MWKEIKKLISVILIEWGFVICPEGEFKEKFAKFLSENLKEF